MHKLWRGYNYDLQVARATLYHREGYMSDDIRGICTRTIDKCENILNRIEKVIDRLEKD